MAAMANPFSEYEKRFLLAEIIKVSDFPLETLLTIIRDGNLQPKWEDIFMPPGRNLTACSAAFQELLSSPPGPQYRPSGFEPQITATRKRRFSDTDPPSVTARILHPKPASNGDPAASFRSASETVSNRRGRPPKAVLEARKAEAALRGQVYPPLKAAGRKSVGSAPSPGMSFGLDGPASEPGPKTEGSSDSPLSKKRRGRPTKEEAEQKKNRMIQIATEAVDTPIVPPSEEKEVPQQAVIESEVMTGVPKDASITMGTPKEIPNSAETIQTHTLPNPQAQYPSNS